MELNVFICAEKKDEEKIKKIKELLQEAEKMLKSEGKDEFHDFSVKPQDKLTDQSHCVVGVASSLCKKKGEIKKNSRALMQAVVILEDDHWDSALRKLLSLPDLLVEFVIRGKGVLSGESKSFRAEDAIQLADIFKNIHREQWRRSDAYSEKKDAKPIDWKCRVSEDDANGFVSFFSDPSMRDMALSLKQSIGSIQKRIELEAQGDKNVLRGCSPLIVGGLSKTDEIAEEDRRVYSILLLGETGTGKSVAANWIAETLKLGSPVRMNVGALPKNMVDIELFGAEKGAYTDASQDRLGFFLENRGRALFMDEIGEMEAQSQVRLLTYLDTAEVRPVGWPKEPLHAPAVVIAATNRPLDEWVQEGNSPFRADLYYRFDHVIKIPPLSHRKKDMRLLICLLLQDSRLNPKSEGAYGVTHISVDAIEYLERGNYPGNFRDLRFRIRKGIHRVLLEGGKTLCLKHLI